MNKNTTKRSLTASVLALVLCVAMLVGSTFAWFTDTASTSVNKIQAGNLKVALEMKDNEGNWVDAKGKTLQFLVNGQIPAEGTQILWEPGCTYELPQLRVRNDGNLALKYKVLITGINGNAKLAEVIDWTLGDVPSGVEQPLGVGESNEFTISGTMREDAGNEYQGLSMDGISITVYAAQNTVESDSIDNSYDANATYDAEIVSDSTQAEAELTKNEKNIRVALGGNITFDVKPYEQKPMGGDATESIVIDGNGYKITFNNTNSDWNNVTWGNAKLTIRNAVIDNSGYKADGGPWNSHDVSFNGNDLVLENVTFTNAVALNGTATLKNVHIEDKNATGDTYMLWICAGSKVYAENLTIDGKSATGRNNRAIAIKDQYIDDPDATELTLNGATIASDKYGAVYVTSASGTTVNLQGTIDITGVASGKLVEKDDESTGTLTVNDNSTKVAKAANQDELNAAITGATEGPVAVKLDEGNYELPALANKDITITGTKDTVIDMKNKLNNNAKNIAFEGVTVAFGTDDYKGFQHSGKLTYKDCVISGKQFLYASEVEFINCEFVQNAVDYNVWTYGAGKVLFKDCTFNCKGKAVLIYNEGSLAAQTVEFQKCKFNASSPAAGKAAIEIDSRFTSYNVIIDQDTAENVTGFSTATVSGSSVWNVKAQAKTTTVVVNGTTVYSK